MSAEVKVSGPLFEGKLDVKAGLREGMEAVAKEGESLARQHLGLRTRFSTPKYGHARDQIRSQVGNRLGKLTLPPGELGARVFIGGQAAYLAPWLEYGTRPHDIPKQTGRGKQRTRIQSVRAAGGIRRALTRSTSVLLAIPSGGGVLFRSYRRDKPFRTRGTKAFLWRQKSQAELDQRAPGILQQYMDAAVTR